MVKRIAGFPLLIIGMLLAQPSGNHAPPLCAAEPSHSQAQADRQSSQSDSKASAPSETIGVSGLVRSTEGTPIPGATVRFTNTDTNQVWVSWTDPAGKFEFPGLPAGPYRAEASQLGFVSSSLEVRLGGGPAPPSLQLSLSVATLAQLTAPAGSEKAANQSNAGGRRGSRNPNAGNAPPSNAGSNAPGGRGGYRGGRGQLPAGVLNAMTQGMAAGGFSKPT